MYFSVLILASQDFNHVCQGHWHHPIPWQTLTFRLDDNRLGGPLRPWSGVHGVHCFHRRSGILICLTTIHVSIVWWSIPDAFEPWEVNVTFEHGLKKLLLCTVKFRVAFLNMTPYCSAWQRFVKVIPSPCGYISYWWMTILDAVLSVVPEITGVQFRLVPLKFLQIPWIVEWYYIMWREKYANPFQSYFEEHGF